MSPLELRVLPGLNAEVSAIGAGCWTIGGPATNRGVPVGWDEVNEDAAYAGLVRAHELGITLYDTADVYGLGRSERLLGQLLSEVPRDELVISSKVGYFVGTSRHPYNRPRSVTSLPPPWTTSTPTTSTSTFCTAATSARTTST